MVANKLMRGDTVLQVAHHGNEAVVVEEVCGRTNVLWEDKTHSPVSDQQPLSRQPPFTPRFNHANKKIPPSWERHTGGSRLKTIVHRCLRLWVARESNTAPFFVRSNIDISFSLIAFPSSLCCCFPYTQMCTHRLAHSPLTCTHTHNSFHMHTHTLTHTA